MTFDLFATARAIILDKTGATAEEADDAATSIAAALDYYEESTNPRCSNCGLHLDAFDAIERTAPAGS